MTNSETVQPGATIPDRRTFQYEVVDMVGGQSFEPVVYDPGCADEARDAVKELWEVSSLEGTVLPFINDTGTARLLAYSFRARPDLGYTLITLHPGSVIVLCPRRHHCTDLNDIGVTL